MHRGDLVQDRYVLLEPIGSGGMAEVWRATDRRLARDVAIKFLSPQLADDPEFLVRFFTEAQILARVSHPAVVDVLDFGQHDERPYLVMEHVPGGAVSDLLGQALLPERIFEIVGEAARGLQAAHADGLVHRDVKPGNILLDAGGRAKVADFGIASSRANERLTATGAAIGSPHYIAPEQVAGERATTRSDVYALGVLLYELLTGHRPFDGDNVTAVALARMDADPPPPSVYDPELSPGVDGVVMKCLARDPDDRYASAGEVADALEGLRSEVQAWEELSTPPAPVVAALDTGGGRVLVGAIVILILLGLASARVITYALQAAP